MRLQRRSVEPVMRSPAAKAGDASAQAGHEVNPLSRAVHPREQFPLHFDLLMRELYSLCIPPEEWQAIAAEEVRLDEDGLDVEFTLINNKDNHVRRRRVEVRQGALMRIRDC